MNILKYNLLLIDGTWLIRRQFFVCNKSIDTETNKPDKYIVIESFLKSLLKFIKEFGYYYRVVILFDRGSYRYRSKEYFVEYKKNRVYDDSFKILWEANDSIIPILRNLGFIVIQIGGLEADDVAHYYSNFTFKKSIMITTDKDWLLNITKKCSLYLANSRKNVYFSDIIHKYGSLKNMLYIKCIKGDKSDNICGASLNKDIIEKILNDWENKDLYISREKVDILDRNYKIFRLDNILNDDEAIESIKNQENLTKIPNQLEILFNLKNINYVNYFLDIINSYNKDWIYE